MIEMHPHARFLADVEQVNKIPVFNSIKGERAGTSREKVDGKRENSREKAVYMA